MTDRMQWEPRHSVGNERLDAQHRSLLAHCDVLAACLEAVDDGRFDETFSALMTLAREHFAAEESLLAQCKCAALDELRSERDEFDYLAEEIVTTANFDRHEVQRFLVLWWTGHIVGAVARYGPCLQQAPE